MLLSDLLQDANTALLAVAECQENIRKAKAVISHFGDKLSLVALSDWNARIAAWEERSKVSMEEAEFKMAFAESL